MKLKTLTVITISIFIVYQAALADINDGLIAYFPFENSSNDNSNTGLIGTMIGDAKFSSGKIGLALSLDGDGDYVDLGNSFNLPTVCSISVWVKTKDVNRKWPAIFAKYETNHYGPFDFELHYDKASLWISDGSGSYTEISSNNTVKENVWTNIIWTVNNTNLKIYINGILDIQASIPVITQNNDTVTIGRQDLMFSPYSDLQFEGLLDELRVYDRLLTNSEIQQLSQVENNDNPWLLFLPAIINSNSTQVKAVRNARNNINKTSGHCTWNGITENGVWADSNWTYCARFTRMCFGRWTGKGNAIDIYQYFYDIGKIMTDIAPPFGAVIFYDIHDENGNVGHVGISAGNQKLISVVNKTNGVLETNIFNYFQANYLGYVTANEFLKNW